MEEGISNYLLTEDFCALILNIFESELYFFLPAKSDSVPL